MDDSSTTTNCGAADLGLAVPAVQALIALITDPARCKARLAELEQKTKAAGEAEAKATAAQKDFEELRASREQDLARREQAVDERERAVIVADQGLREREAALRKERLALNNEDQQLRRRVMLVAGISVNERLQSLPSWNELRVELFGGSSTEGRGGDPLIEEQPPHGGGFELTAMPGSSITQSRPESRSARRRQHFAQ